MTYILNIETATKVCSVSVSKNGADFLVKEFESESFSHSEKLNVFIEEMLADSAITLNNLDAVAVSAGPGSYTGLRIGSSSAKGLCFALDIPFISVNTMQAMTNYVRRAHPDFDIYIPMIDARRMEVYASIFNSGGEMIREVKAEILEAGMYDEYISGKQQVLVFGNGAEKSKEIFDPENIQFDINTNVSALGMNQIAYDKYQQKRFEDLAYFEPNYLKDFIAGKPKKLL